MDEKQFQELVKKVGEEAAKLIKTDVEAATKGMLTFEQLEAKLAALTPEAKSIKIGEKSIEDILREQGEAITVLKGQGTPGNSKSMKEMLSEKMGDVERAFKSKQGEVRLSLKAAAIMTTDNTIDDSDLPDDLIESFSVGAFVEKRRPRQYVFDIADRTTVQEIDQYKTWLEEGGEQGAFAIVSEGAIKPLVSMALVRNTSEYKKVAGKYVVTEEFAKFRKNAYTIIRRLISDKMLRDYSALLTTDLIADAAAYTATALDAQYANPTDYHAVGAVAAQIESLNFMPDVLIMNPQDKWRIGLSQDQVGQFYLNIPVTDPSGETRMMGFTLRTSNYVPVGDFILGEGGLWKIEDEAITIRMGMGITDEGAGVYSSDFDNNRFRVIVETYFHDYIATNHTGSFVYANFADVKAALLAPEV